MTLSKPSWSGAALRAVVAVVLVGLVAAVIAWERRVAPVVPAEPAAEAPAAHEPLRLEATADSSGSLRLSWEPDPRADAYELELLDERLAVLATEGPLGTPACTLAFDRVPATARWCRVTASREGERLGESAKLELWPR